MKIVASAIRRTVTAPRLRVPPGTSAVVGVADLADAIDAALGMETRLPSPVKIYDVAERMMLRLKEQGR